MAHNDIIPVMDEKAAAVETLMAELEKGRNSGETEGWLTPEEVYSHIQEKANT